MKMSKLSHDLVLTAPTGDAISVIADKITSKIRQTEPYVIVWWVFVASVAFSNIPILYSGLSGPLSYIVTIGGSAGCAWGWLFSRSLFRPAKSAERWPILAVGAVVAIESGWAIIGESSAMGLSGELRRIVGNAASLVCFSALALIFVEALSGYGVQMPRPERRFRQIFVFVFGAMIAVSMVWAINIDEASYATQWRDVVLAGCALCGVIGSRAAISFRKRNPLIDGKALAPSKSPSSPLSPAASDEALARRILDAMENETIFTTPNLKVAKFAEALGEHDYKVTQCITGQLRYRNFNHFINSRRIAHARQTLLDAKNDNRSIVAIAFECGFNSIGPFNRTFKQDVGMTPRDFRASRIKEFQDAQPI